jgi:hypothetical protein
VLWCVGRREGKEVVAVGSRAPITKGSPAAAGTRCWFCWLSETHVSGRSIPAWESEVDFAVSAVELLKIQRRCWN